MKRGALEEVFIDVDVIDWLRVQLNQLGVRRKSLISYQLDRDVGLVELAN
jgi:hypothetical protein